MAKKWYVIHTYSGYEAKVRDALQQRVKQYSLEDQVRRDPHPERDGHRATARAARPASARSSACPATSSSRWR